MDSTYPVSILVILIFVSFLFLYGINSFHSNGLRTIRKHIIRNFIPFILLLAITASATIYYDKEYGVYGAIGLISITILFFLMSMMETPIKESFDDGNNANIQLLKVLKELHTCVESSENANTSLPNKL